MAANRNKPLIKFLRARLLLDDARSLLRGWYFRQVSPGDQLQGGIAGDLNEIVLSQISIRLKWKDELKEFNHGRFHNMNLGCRIVNGTIIPPGHVFSLRRFLKGATEEQGFMAGPMFIRGRTEFVPGGSACLISTLLFNVALLANLEILEKHNHSTDMWGEERFIDLGLDATYVYGRKDFKFRNTHGADIRIAAEMNGYDLVCRLVSSKPIEGTATIETETLEELYPQGSAESRSLTEPTRPYRKGCVVRTKRTVRCESGSSKTTYVKVETYKPFYLG